MDNPTHYLNSKSCRRTLGRYPSAMAQNPDLAANDILSYPLPPLEHYTYNLFIKPVFKNGITTTHPSGYQTADPFHKPIWLPYPVGAWYSPDIHCQRQPPIQVIKRRYFSNPLHKFLTRLELWVRPCVSYHTCSTIWIIWIGWLLITIPAI